MERVSVHGTISAAGFATGDRFVVGCWRTSPIGPFVDVMWGTGDGRRVLLAPGDEAAEFITSIYEFDEVQVAPLVGSSDGTHTVVGGHGLQLELHGGRGRHIPVKRPLAFTRLIEAPIARRLLGVETFGTSSKGATEWYQARRWRWVVGGSATLDGVDLGPPGHITSPLRVGFSEPPERPSIVTVDVTIDLPQPLHSPLPPPPGPQAS